MPACAGLRHCLTYVLRVCCVVCGGTQVQAAQEGAAAAAALCRAKAGELYAQLRALVRHHAAETAGVCGELAGVLREPGVPDRAVQVVQEMLHYDV